MKNHLLKKILALSLFIGGISVFVLHQSGYFSGNGYAGYQGSHNGGAITTGDSLNLHRRDSVRLLQWSSKSAAPLGRMKLSVNRWLYDNGLIKPNTKPMIMPGSKVYIPVKPVSGNAVPADSAAAPLNTNED
jgi:hypothetical protein